MNKFIKKIFLSIVTLFLMLPFANVVFGSETKTQILYGKGGLNDPVRHYGTNKYVEVVSKYETAYSEMRGVWVATVYNIAISKQDGLNEEAIKDYKEEFISILDRMEEYGMNTLFFQVRPCNDAFYKSELNPWSEFLAGRGKDPGWDPLEWMVEQTHDRGFSFMCWMNAFRVTTSTYIPGSTTTNPLGQKIGYSDAVKYKHQTLNELADGNFAKEHPECVLAGSYDEKLILNPSDPVVQKFIVDTIMEIVENYDVDGLHFDDYFYLNGSPSTDATNTNFVGREGYTKSGKDILNDWPNYYEYQKDPENYGKDIFGESGVYGIKAGLSLGDFRRENINNMMRNIRIQIDAYNEKTGKCVEFGTKPAAVWRSNSEYCPAGSTRCHENGSNTAVEAYSTYCDLYADSLQWVEEGLVDWVAPQIYYSFEDAYAPYADVVDWWVQQVDRINARRTPEGEKEIKLYIAHGIYKYRDAPEQFYAANEMLNQLKYNKNYDTIKGSAVYSYEILYEALSNSKAETTRQNAMKFFKNAWAKSLPYPVTVGENDSDGLKVETYKIKESSTGNITLSFDTVENARAYGLYKVAKDEQFDKTNLNDRINVFYEGYKENKKVTIDLGTYDEQYDYYVVAVSKNGYVSEEYTKLDMTTKTVNSAPTSIEINLFNQQGTLVTSDYNYVMCGDVVEICFDKPSDIDGDIVNFESYFVENDYEQKIYPEIVEENNQIKIKFETYYFDALNCKFRIKMTDGDLSTICDTVSFNLVEIYPILKGTISKLNESYTGEEKLIGTFTDAKYKNNAKFSYNAYLVIGSEESKMVVNESSNQFEIMLPNIDAEDCYVKIVATSSGISTSFISNKFDIKKKVCNHIWENATCIHPKKCSICNEVDGEPLGHDYSEATCTKDSTCSRCGDVFEKAYGHKWIDATCITPKECSVCHATDGEALGHTCNDATCTEDSICTICGYTTQKALGHKWIEATKKAPKTCSVCGETEGEPIKGCKKSSLGLILIFTSIFTTTLFIFKKRK